MKPGTIRLRFGLIVAVALSALAAAEAYVVFVDQTGTFRIEGRQPAEFGDLREAPVSHVFLMSGEGLTRLRFKLVGRSWDVIDLSWTLWRGNRDEAPPLTVAATGTRRVALRPGSQWVSVDVPRDGSSHNRYYTIELKLEAPPQQPAAQLPFVAVLGTHDNPDRGGVLWFGETRLSGSMVLHAESRGRTLYRRFQQEIEPDLPAAMRNHALQWMVVIALHWALIVWVAAMLEQAWRAPRG